MVSVLVSDCIGKLFCHDYILQHNKKNACYVYDQSWQIECNLFYQILYFYKFPIYDTQYKRVWSFLNQMLKREEKTCLRSEPKVNAVQEWI